jgi:hypothetical protein
MGVEGGGCPTEKKPQTKSGHFPIITIDESLRDFLGVLAGLPSFDPSFGSVVCVGRVNPAFSPAAALRPF